jgi:hypothetical protein
MRCLRVSAFDNGGNHLSGHAHSADGLVPRHLVDDLPEEWHRRVGVATGVGAGQLSDGVDLPAQAALRDGSAKQGAAIHTNGIENFWSLLKRGLTGTYISVEPVHLDKYVDEQVFRYNNRHKMNDSGRFSKVLSQIKGKRLTYAELAGKEAGAEVF